MEQRSFRLSKNGKLHTIECGHGRHGDTVYLTAQQLATERQKRCYNCLYYALSPYSPDRLVDKEENVVWSWHES